MVATCAATSARLGFAGRTGTAVAPGPPDPVARCAIPLRAGAGLDPNRVGGGATPAAARHCAAARHFTGGGLIGDDGMAASYLKGEQSQTNPTSARSKVKIGAAHACPPNDLVFDPAAPISGAKS